MNLSESATIAVLEMDKDALWDFLERVEVVNDAMRKAVNALPIEDYASFLTRSSVANAPRPGEISEYAFFKLANGKVKPIDYDEAKPMLHQALHEHDYLVDELLADVPANKLVDAIKIDDPLERLRLAGYEAMAEALQLVVTAVHEEKLDAPEPIRKLFADNAPAWNALAFADADNPTPEQMLSTVEEDKDIADAVVTALLNIKTTDDGYAVNNTPVDRDLVAALLWLRVNGFVSVIYRLHTRRRDRLAKLFKAMNCTTARKIIIDDVELYPNGLIVKHEDEDDDTKQSAIAKALASLKSAGARFVNSDGTEVDEKTYAAPVTLSADLLVADHPLLQAGLFDFPKPAEDEETADPRDRTLVNTIGEYRAGLVKARMAWQQLAKLTADELLDKMDDVTLEKMGLDRFDPAKVYTTAGGDKEWRGGALPADLDEATTDYIQSGHGLTAPTPMTRQQVATALHGAVIEDQLYDPLVLDDESFRTIIETYPVNIVYEHLYPDEYKVLTGKDGDKKNEDD